MRKVLGIFIGLIAAIVLLFGLEFIGRFIYPPPAHLDPMDIESLNNYMKNVPNGSLILVLISHFVSLLFGNYIAIKLSKGDPVSVYTVSGIFGLMVFFNLWVLDHPFWFSLLDIVLVGIALWIPLKMKKEKERIN